MKRTERRRFCFAVSVSAPPRKKVLIPALIPMLIFFSLIPPHLYLRLASRCGPHVVTETPCEDENKRAVRVKPGAVMSRICPVSQRAGGGGAAQWPVSHPLCGNDCRASVFRRPLLQTQTPMRGVGARTHARGQTAAIFKLHFAIFFYFKHANGQLAMIFFFRPPNHRGAPATHTH